MNSLKKVTVGTREKCDILLTMSIIDSSSNEIELKGPAVKLFSKQMYDVIEKTLEALNIKGVRVEGEDNGSWDYILMARLEAAAFKLGIIDNNVKCLPEKKVHRNRTNKNRLRRSRLYIPGNTGHMMQNAGLFGADSIILDLEDAVSIEQKIEARYLVRNTLRIIDFKDSEVIIRINPLDSQWGVDDLEQVVPAEPDVILLPKCESKEDIDELAAILQELEEKNNIEEPIWIMPLIETAKGVLKAYEIASSNERVVALCFGAEDFTADMGISRTREGKETLWARQMIAISAKAAGIQAMDTVFSDLDDMEGLYLSAKEAKEIGFDGKGLIHPSQIAVVHQAFKPDKKEVEKAKRIVEAFEESQKRGLGVISVDGKMIDLPVVKRAQKILELAKYYKYEEGE